MHHSRAVSGRPDKDLPAFCKAAIHAQISKTALTRARAVCGSRTKLRRIDTAGFYRTSREDVVKSKPTPVLRRGGGELARKLCRGSSRGYLQGCQGTHRTCACPFTLTASGPGPLSFASLPEYLPTFGSGSHPLQFIRSAHRSD